MRSKNKTSLQISYVMGQINLKLDAQHVTHQTNHYTKQEYLLGNLSLWQPNPPLTLNLRDLSSNKPIILSKAQVRSIKNTSPSHPSITIFIHGYNVGLGDYGRELLTHGKTSATTHQVSYQHLDVLQKFHADDDLYCSEKPATIYRNLGALKKDFSPAINALSFKDDGLNGDGAHNWWVHMEYNLNRAAGFKGFDFYYRKNSPHYTRILNIAWSGDPASPLDYLAIEPTAEQTAKRLMPVIKQLCQAGIEINIIAHSAGNIVLIKLMEELGLNVQYHNCISNVFMWQAAMPNYVLSPNANHEDDSLTSFWKTPHAHLAARKIHVLYSHHDNILGPIPLHVGGKKDTRFHEKWHTPGGGESMAFMALSVDVLDQQLGTPNALKSAYHIAHLFQVPFTALLYDAKLRSSIYAKWYQKYKKQLTQTAYCADLSDQVNVVKKNYPNIFDQLALFMSLYSAVMHDGMLSFLSNMKNDERLAKFLLRLSPMMAGRLLANIKRSVGATIGHHDRRKIFLDICHYAKKHASFSYLKSLWLVLLMRQSYWLKAHEKDIKQFLISKSHDFILHGPSQILGKTSELEFQSWEYLLRYFHQKESTHKDSVFKRGHDIACRGSEVAAFVMTILNAPGTEPSPAMGYSGINLIDPQISDLVDQGKIIQVDQSEYLLHHSGMKVVNTSDDVFKHIYQGVIMQSEGMRFGAWL